MSFKNKSEKKNFPSLSLSVYKVFILCFLKINFYNFLRNKNKIKFYPEHGATECNIANNLNFSIYKERERERDTFLLSQGLFLLFNFI